MVRIPGIGSKYFPPPLLKHWIGIGEGKGGLTGAYLAKVFPVFGDSVSIPSITVINCNIWSDRKKITAGWFSFLGLNDITIEVDSHWLNVSIHAWMPAQSWFDTKHGTMWIFAVKKNANNLDLGLKFKANYNPKGYYLALKLSVWKSWKAFWSMIFVSASTWL